MILKVFKLVIDSKYFLEVISDAKMETGILAQDLQEGDLDLNLSTISEESRGVLSSILGHQISDKLHSHDINWHQVVLIHWQTSHST